LNEFNFWKFAHDSVINKKNLILLIVSESSNSSPGRAGFKMLIDENKNSFGTIGGGIMEKQMVDFALSMFASFQKYSVKRLQHSNESNLESSGLICGGYQTIIFRKLDSSDENILHNIVATFDNESEKTLEIRNGNISVNETGHSQSEIFFSYINESEWTYQQKIGNPNTVYIIGGGHVGKAVSDIMKMLGFYVVIFDHRHDVFTMLQNTSADKKIIIDYSAVGNFIRETEKSFVVICTPKHEGDKTALLSVINKKVKYIGMMGSKRKIKTIFDEVRKSGISNELISNIHSPVGLEINSETPYEIAVSIAAEIIKVKNSGKNVR
jgi:xanthine dehydrogenase accessory factor